MAFCLNKNTTETFLKKLKSGEIDPVKLSEMTSKARRGVFAEFMGVENAQKTNALFESKLLLKNQQRGMVNWAKEISGLKPAQKRDLVSRIEKMDEILNPETQEAFLEDLAAHKLQATVSMAEASEISRLAKDVSEKKVAINPDSPIASEDRMEYGRAMVDFKEYVDDLKIESQKTTFADIKAAPAQAALKGLSSVGGLAKSLKATLDNSVIARQGLKVLFAEPGTWARNSLKTFTDMWKVFGGKDAMREVRADVLSRPNSLNGLYQKEKLAIGVTEEAFPSVLPAKVPILGKLFKASETAFTAFQYRTRADIFDKWTEIAGRTGADITGIGKIANSLTGRGTFGQRLESVATFTNNVFFSPRFLKSNIDILTMHGFDSGIGPFARRRAVMNTIKVITGVASVLAIAKAVAPNSVDFDPRSADFGKIKVGNTRFDFSGGSGSIVTLASRLITNQTKSSTTGIIRDLGTGKFGSRDRMDVIINFFENKLSPLVRTFRDILRNRDFDGNKPNIFSVTSQLFTPFPIQNTIEILKKPEGAPLLIAVLADYFGISVNTYGPESNWQVSSSIEMTQFREKRGEAALIEANDLFNKEYQEWFSSIKDTDGYKNLSDTDKIKGLSSKKKEIKKSVFDEYKFKPIYTKKKPVRIEENRNE